MRMRDCDRAPRGCGLGAVMVIPEAPCGEALALLPTLRLPWSRRSALSSPAAPSPARGPPTPRPRRRNPHGHVEYVVRASSQQGGYRLLAPYRRGRMQCLKVGIEVRGVLGSGG